MNATAQDLRWRLLETFHDEAAEHLDGIRAWLDAGQQDKAAVEEAFRRAHSLKGAARAVDLRPVEAQAHELESLLGQVRAGDLTLAAMTPAAQELVDAIEDLVASSRNPQATSEPAAATKVTEAAAPEAERTSPAAASLRVSTRALDVLMHSVGQLSGEASRQDHFAGQMALLTEHMARTEVAWERARAAGAGLGDDTPGFELMQAEIQAGAEALRMLGRDLRRVRQQHRRSAWSLRQLSGRIIDDVRAVRTITAGSVYLDLRRFMRQAASETGRRVTLNLEGMETTADRVVLQSLYDPILHLLRNALSHGIEVADERRRSGKPEEGQVRLSLAAQGSRLLIEVEDDGAGIDLEKVARMGVERGILTATEAATATPEQISQVLFRSGFSTAGQVTDLSGRGVGLAIVDEAVKRLQGVVRVTGQVGQGTCFTLDVPLFLSSERLLLVDVGGQVFGLPCRTIERLLRCREQELDVTGDQRTLRSEGSVMSCIDLGALLDVPARTGNDPFLRVVVLRRGHERLAVVVDGLRSVREALVEDTGDPLARGMASTGGFMLEDGDIVVVLDPEALFERARSSSRSTRATVQPEVDTSPASILVVDDSITTRTLEKSLLEAHGFDVRVAVDGVEALDLLRANPVDLVVSDVEMPRMDGFDLLSRIRQEESLQHIPVILVTSLEQEHHRRRGLELGASAYVVKQKFDQRDLLETIEQLL